MCSNSIAPQLSDVDARWLGFGWLVRRCFCYRVEIYDGHGSS